LSCSGTKIIQIKSPAHLNEFSKDSRFFTVLQSDRKQTNSFSQLLIILTNLQWAKNKSENQTLGNAGRGKMLKNGINIVVLRTARGYKTHHSSRQVIYVDGINYKKGRPLIRFQNENHTHFG
jgi:hypothetical protein